MVSYVHKSTEGIVSRIIGWKKKRALFQDRREGKRQQKEEGEKKIEWFPIRVVRVGKCRWRGKRERKKTAPSFSVNASCPCHVSVQDPALHVRPPLHPFLFPPLFQGLFDFFFA